MTYGEWAVTDVSSEHWMTVARKASCPCIRLLVTVGPGPLFKLRPAKRECGGLLTAMQVLNDEARWGEIRHIPKSPAISSSITMSDPVL